MGEERHPSESTYLIGELQVKSRKVKVKRGEGKGLLPFTFTLYPWGMGFVNL